MIRSAILYAIALAFIAYGVRFGPASGWPVNGGELNACAALIVGMIAKVAGHISLGLVR